MSINRLERERHTRENEDITVNFTREKNLQMTDPSMKRSPGRAALSHTGHTHLALLIYSGKRVKLETYIHGYMYNVQYT